MRKPHPFTDMLLSLKGNQKSLVLLEPFWGIPFNLFAPYATLYMFALGVKDAQIGLIASIGMVFQIFFSLIGGVVTDKLGRRMTTLVFDMITWVAAPLVLAFSSSFNHFLIAAIIGAVIRIPMNSWTGLLAEDAKKDQVVGIYTLIYIVSLGAAFFAPISGFFVDRHGLVPAVRVLYIIMALSMAFKSIAGYIWTKETEIGRMRMEQTRNVSVFKLLGQYGGVAGHIIKNPATLTTLGIMLIMNITNIVNTNFWMLYASEGIGIPEGTLSIFPFIRSIVMLICFFTILPHVRTDKFKKPMYFGFTLFTISRIVLLIVPPESLIILSISMIIEAVAVTLIAPLLDSMQIVMLDPNERSRIISLIFMLVIALSSPFGWFSGILSAMDRRLPFLMVLGLLLIGFILIWKAKEPENEHIVSSEVQ